MKCHQVNIEQKNLDVAIKKSLVCAIVILKLFIFYCLSFYCLIF